MRKFKTGGRPWVTGEVEKAEKSWYMKNVEWTHWEKRLAVAEMTRIGVMIMMNTHLFQWAGKFYLQRKRRPHWVACNVCGGKSHNALLGKCS